MIMTREEEIHEAAKNWAYNTFSNSKMQAFKEGAKYADSHPQYFRGQTDEMMEREAAFAKDWLREHKGERPTYADAIAWAEKRVIEKANEWLFDNTDSYMVVAGTGHWINNMGLIKDFKKAMEE